MPNHWQRLVKGSRKAQHNHPKLQTAQSSLCDPAPNPCFSSIALRQQRRSGKAPGGDEQRQSSGSGSSCCPAWQMLPARLSLSCVQERRGLENAHSPSGKCNIPDVTAQPVQTLPPSANRGKRLMSQDPNCEHVPQPQALAAHVHSTHLFNSAAGHKQRCRGL